MKMKMKKVSWILMLSILLSVVNIPIINAEGEAVTITSYTDNTGNIFFNNEAIVMTFNFANNTDKAISDTVTYQVYKLDEENQPQAFAEPMVKELSIDANGTAVQKVNLPADDFGLYSVTVILTTLTDISYETEFSKSVKSNMLNYSLGVTAHLTDEEEEVIKTRLDLLENSGMGLVRTDFPWPGYESWDVNKKGEFDLTHRKLDIILREITERDMDLLPILGTSHPSYITADYNTWVKYRAGVYLDEENIDAYKNFLVHLLNEPAFKAANITKVEIQNEPDLKSLYKYRVLSNEVRSSDENVIEDYKFKGRLMANIYKTSYTTIKEIDPAIQVGIGSLSGNYYMDNVKRFTDAFLNEFKGVKYFDTFSLHPYISMMSVNRNPESPEESVNDLTDYYRDLLSGKEPGIYTNNTYNFGDNELWHTEFGWWKNNTINEFMQGVKTIRQYAYAYAHANNDKFYIYNFMNSGLDESNAEHNFGMVKNVEYKVPYAAKYTYLQYANLNRLVADKDICKQVVDGTDNTYVTEFSSKWNDNKVYMLWTTEESASTDYTIPSDSGIVYYDILGNNLETSEVENEDGTYKLTGVPFYAVTGSSLSNIDEETSLPIDAVTVDAKTNSVTLEGYLGTKGKTVTAIVLKPETDIQNVKNEEIIFVDEITTQNRGYYSFTFKDNDAEAGEYTIIYNIDGGDTAKQQTFSYSGTVTVPIIEILSNGKKIRSLTEITTNDLTLNVRFPKVIDAMILCAQYKEDRLVRVDMDVLNGDSMKKPFTYEGSGNVDKIRVFFWNSTTQEPIIKEYKIN